MKNLRPSYLGTSLIVLCLLGSNLLSGEIINIGSHKLEVQAEGRGAPPVVIDSGLGDGMEKLKPLQDRLSGVTRVVTYNRAGYGQSEPGPLPRDAGREADELKAVLDGAGIPGPYILVGHSLGALNMSVFTHKYPELVAGLVLLDPPPLSFITGEDFKMLLAMAERMTAQWQIYADQGAESSDPGERARAVFFQTLASEHRELFGASARLVSEISSFADIPLIVMAAGRANPAFGEIAEEYQDYWIEQSRAFSQKSSDARFILAETSSHHLYIDVPELVEEAVVSLVQRTREK
ncbi:MAG: alpha/beta hydrolase [Acidobacteriota bacterium]|nr:MAG: alpha/beta hydrolase [Acidobacteriota bacterium]